MATAVFVLKFTNKFTVTVTFLFTKKIIKYLCWWNATAWFHWRRHYVIANIRDISDTYIENIPVRLVFTCKVAHQKSRRSVNINKLLWKNEWQLYYLDTVYYSATQLVWVYKHGMQHPFTSLRKVFVGYSIHCVAPNSYQQTVLMSDFCVLIRA